METVWFGLIFCASRVTTSSPGRSPAATMTRLCFVARDRDRPCRYRARGGIDDPHTWLPRH